MASCFANIFRICLDCVVPTLGLRLIRFGVIMLVEGCLLSVNVTPVVLRVCCMGASLGIVYDLVAFKSFASSKVVHDAHAACLDARDYSGCVNSFQNGVKQGSVGENTG